MFIRKTAVKREKHYYVVLLLIGLFICNIINAQSVQTSRAVKKPLVAPVMNTGFNFLVFSDRTGSDDAEATKIWGKAVQQANRMQPDFVMTVGDLIQGYGGRESWLEQTAAFLAETNKLTIPWYPVAGNHDVYWYRDTEGRPNDHHESDYESHFGPLWYVFEYDNCWFIVLYSDEGDYETGEKDYNNAALQKMSDQQYNWLKETLDKAKDADHVFLFLHHPRWLGTHYGDSWQRVHELLKNAGNVSAVFAGHYHRMLYSQMDGIDYYVLATTGGTFSHYSIDDQHLWYWVAVQPNSYFVSAIPIDAMIDPKDRQMKSVTLVPKQAWDIRSKEQVVEFEISTQDYDFNKGKIDVCLVGGYDESGDHKLEASLLDAGHNVMHKGKSGEKEAHWLDFPAAPKTTYYLQLQDPDASFEGPDAGNQGQIEITLSYYIQTKE